MTTRPDPDALLDAAAADRVAHGQLRIFLGYAAGVGKSYAMLEAAQQRRSAGVDVVAGYVETHGRRETDALVAGLEVMPRRVVEYRGLALSELDVDAVLARRPQLVLVDEYAHTNAPGSRHPKRYQDVAELLAAGLDVYTTLNIQHLESLKDAVAQITGVVVHETVPDGALDEATEIELVDLPPAELRRRLAAGQVYVPEQAARASAGFFRAGNLTALREMALRRVAVRVDDQMRAYMRSRAIPGPWPAHERLLVLISSSAFGERLVRSARRLADELTAEWFAVYVEAPGHAALTAAQHDQIARTQQLAQALGAKTLVLPGAAVTEAALAYAHQHNITKIIVGKPLRPRWHELLRRSVVDQLIHDSGPIDIYVISEIGPAPALPAGRAGWPLHRPYRRYWEAAGLVLVATLLGSLIELPLSLEKLGLLASLLLTGTRPDSPVLTGPPSVEPTNVVMLYLAVVVFTAVNLGRGPAILASFLSVLAFDIVFVQPYLSLAILDPQYLLTFVGLLVVGLVISSLAARAREQAEAAQRREEQMAALYDLSRDLAAAAELPSMLARLVSHVAETFGRASVILLPSDNRLTTAAASVDLTLDSNELVVADWVYRHGEPAGRNTSTLPAAALRYLPLKTARGGVGVLGITAGAAGAPELSVDQRRLLEAFATQAAQAIERVQLADAARRAEVLEAAEKLQTALLNSISHDLRTPLVSITGALTSLRGDQAIADAATRDNLLENAALEADRLNRLVGNLLDMTRLEAGVLHVTRTPAEIEDVIGAALNRMDAQLHNRRVAVQLPADLPSVPMDFVLILQVLTNLLDNALKYSPADAPVELSAEVKGEALAVSVADRGLGIPPEERAHVFDKFYRVQRSNQATGTGLGLSISKGMVEAHGGTIRAEGREGGGTVVVFTLPLR